MTPCRADSRHIYSTNLQFRTLGGLDGETASSAAEEKQLREWWLTVNDALDENQRQMVATFLAGQMARVMDAGPQHSAERSGKGEGGGHGGRQKGGGRGGMNVGMGVPGA